MPTAWGSQVILEFLLEYRWSGEVCPFWNIPWNIRLYLRLSNLECYCIPDVTPGASHRERLSLSFELPNSSNRVYITTVGEDLLAARVHFSSDFARFASILPRFCAISELHRPSKGLSPFIYSKICWNMLWNIDGPAGIS